MDISTIFGLVAALGLVVFGIMDGGEISNFIDMSSVYITVGGTFATLFITTPMETIVKVPTYFLRALLPKKYDPRPYIKQIVEIAFDARKNGLLSLESKIEEYKDPFLKKGVLLVVDSTDPEMIRDIMETELTFMLERHQKAITFFEKGAAFGPGFGMIGTLVGLINMLTDLSDADNLASGMGTALITTLYGSMLANVFFSPMAGKLKQQSNAERLCRQIIIEGVLAIQGGKNPKQIQEKLVSFLPPKMRDLDKVKGGKGGGGDGGE